MSHRDQDPIRAFLQSTPTAEVRRLERRAISAILRREDPADVRLACANWRTYAAMKEEMLCPTLPN